MSLAPEQLERYARHIMLREIGGPGQRKLLDSHAVVIGAGALGGPVATYLAAAGMGRLTVIDDDTVSLSNLQRQTQFTTTEVGRPKGEALAARLGALNLDTRVTTRQVRLTSDNARDLLAGANIVLDGTDSFTTRFDVNAAAHALGLPLVSGAVGRWSGQLSVFKSGLTKAKPQAERLPCYRCFVPDMPETEETCAMVGVIGPLTGIVGARMALEAVKEITGAGQSMAGRVWLYDGLSGDSRTIKLSADPACPVCG